MGEFIRLEIDRGKCIGVRDCGQCINVCPLAIFKAEDHQPLVVSENEDECTLCELCLRACEMNAITLVRLYEP